MAFGKCPFCKHNLRSDKTCGCRDRIKENQEAKKIKEEKEK